MTLAFLLDDSIYSVSFPFENIVANNIELS